MLSLIQAHQIVCEFTGARLINLAVDDLGVPELFQAEVFGDNFQGPWRPAPPCVFKLNLPTALRNKQNKTKQKALPSKHKIKPL